MGWENHLTPTDKSIGRNEKKVKKTSEKVKSSFYRKAGISKALRKVVEGK